MPGEPPRSIQSTAAAKCRWPFAGFVCGRRVAGYQQHRDRRVGQQDGQELGGVGQRIGAVGDEDAAVGREIQAAQSVQQAAPVRRGHVFAEYRQRGGHREYRLGIRMGAAVMRQNRRGTGGDFDARPAVFHPGANRAPGQQQRNGFMPRPPFVQKAALRHGTAGPLFFG